MNRKRAIKSYSLPWEALTLGEAPNLGGGTQSWRHQFNAQHINKPETLFRCKRFIYPIRKVLFLDESGHEPQLRAVHADGAIAKSAKMGGEARPSGSGVGLMHRLCSGQVVKKKSKMRAFPLKGNTLKINSWHWKSVSPNNCPHNHNTQIPKIPKYLNTNKEGEKK